MTAGPWVDRAYVGILPDLSRFVTELSTGLSRSMGAVQREVDRTATVIERRFDRLAVDANHSLNQIGDDAVWAALRASADATGEHIERSFAEAQRGADESLNDIGRPGQFLGVTTQARAATERVEHDFNRASVSGRASLAGMRVALFGIGGAATAAFGLVGLAAGKMGLSAAAAMEQAQISFAQLLGSGQKAKGFLEDLNEFAAKTPFELPGLISAARSLLGAGQTAADVIPIMRALGNATGALGLDQEAFGRIMLATTQAMNKGRLQGEELMQMQEAGLPVTKMLADALGVESSEISELAQKGKLTSDEVLPKLFAEMQKDYGGSMIKQSQTLNGLMSTFMDTTRNALREGIEPLIPAIKDALPKAAEILESSIRATTNFLQHQVIPTLSNLKGWWDDNQYAIYLLAESVQSVLGPSLSLMGGLAGDASGEVIGLRDALDWLLITMASFVQLGDLMVITLGSIAFGAAATVEAIGHLANAVDFASKGFGLFGDATSHAGDTLIRFGQDLEDKTMAAVHGARDSFEQAGLAQDRLAESTRKATEDADGHAAALRRERDAIDQLTGAQDDEKEAELRLRQAKITRARAQDRVNQLTRDGKKGSNDYKQAQLDLERAQYNVKDATDDYKTAQKFANAATSGAMQASQRAQPSLDKLGATAKTGADKAHDAKIPWRQLGEQLDTTFREIHSKTAQITAKFGWQGLEVFSVPNSRMKMMAGGGRITEGTGPTADDVLIRASRGETVVSAAHSRDPWFQDWAADVGIPGFATGGVIPQFRMVGADRFVHQLRLWDNRVDAVIDRAAAAVERSLGRLGAAPPHAAGGWQAALSFLSGLHIPYNVISTFRPGAVTHASHRQSYHALNRAVDLTSPAGVAGMMRIWAALTRTNPSELIFAHAPYYIARGRSKPIGQLDPITFADHLGHVHAAYDLGGYLRPGFTPSWNFTGHQERVLNPAETAMWERLEQQMGTRTAPIGGGVQVVQHIHLTPADARIPGLAEAMAVIGRSQVRAALADADRATRRGGRA